MLNPSLPPTSDCGASQSHRHPSDVGEHCRSEGSDRRAHLRRAGDCSSRKSCRAGDCGTSQGRGEHCCTEGSGCGVWHRHAGDVHDVGEPGVLHECGCAGVDGRQLRSNLYCRVYDCCDVSAGAFRASWEMRATVLHAALANCRIRCSGIS